MNTDAEIYSRARNARMRCAWSHLNLRATVLGMQTDGILLFPVLALIIGRKICR